MKVIVYSTTTCPYCEMLKDYLEGKGISFKEKLVDQDDAAREEMERESRGFLGVPYSVIVKDDGAKIDVIGFDKGKLDEIFNSNA